MKAFLLPISLALLSFVPAAICSPPSYAPQAISARFNVRYSWALSKNAKASIGKDRMATTDRYDLPAAKAVIKGAAAESTIQGGVDGLPFEFYLRLTRSSNADPGLLEVNVIDRKTRQTLPGFPKKIPQAMSEFNENNGLITVELKLTKAEDAALEHWLSASLKENGTVTKGPLIVDPPFLLVGTGTEQ